MFPSYSTHYNHSHSQACASFSLRSAPWDSTKTLVHSLGYPVEAPPMYSVITSKHNTPNVIVSRGWGGGPCDIIGDARLPSLSSNIYLMLYGQSMNMRFSQISGNCTLEPPAMGRMKWKLDMLTGRKIELHDGTGSKLAKLRPEGKSGEKVLEILVPHDTRFLELVLLSGLTVKTMNSSMAEATGEVLGAVLGA